MRPKNNLPIEVLRTHLMVQESGLVFWKEARQGRSLDKPAGTVHPRGYWQINLRIDGVDYRLYSHRIVYALEHGEWPPSETDHMDEDKGHNAPKNLRLATCSENKCNRGKQKNNTSGMKWVKANKRGRSKPWRAAVRKDGKVQERTGFATREEAFAWASSIAKQAHGEFYNPGQGG